MYTFWQRFFRQAWAWFFCHFRPAPERCHGQAAFPRCCRAGDLSPLPSQAHFVKVLRQWFPRPAKLHARCFAASIPCRCRLRIFSRSLCATNERICSTMSAMNVPIRSLPCRVSSSGMSSTKMSTPVDAHDIEQIARFQPPQQPLVLQPVEVHDRLLVHVDPVWRNRNAAQRDHLPVLVLIRRRHTDIAIYAHFISSLETTKAREQLNALRAFVI